MAKTAAFDKHVAEYEAWFKKYDAVFRSEVEAIREMLPPGDSYGIEIGLGTGKFAIALGIKEGIEPSAPMRELALSRGIEVMNAAAEHLPYRDMHFDFVLMVTCINFLDDPNQAFKEAHRVLKRGGRLIIGTIEKYGNLGRAYEARKAESTFYREANFYSTDKLEERLRSAGFRQFEYSQTLFHGLDEIKEFEPAKPGFGEGSFVVIKATKK